MMVNVSIFGRSIQERITILNDCSALIDDIYLKVANTMEMDPDEFYLIYNGKILKDLSCIDDTNDLPVHIVPRVLGGKGGFGSMLRAIGAQIEKTTNRDACRDLSGRRLRDINEEQRLKRWFAKQKQRDEEKAELKKKKLDRLRQLCEGPSLPKMEDKEYNRTRAEMSDAVYEAVEKGFEPPTSSKQVSTGKNGTASSTSSCSSLSSDEGEECKDFTAEVEKSEHESQKQKDISTKETKLFLPKLKRTMLDEDLDSDASSSDSETDERSSKKIKIG